MRYTYNSLSAPQAYTGYGDYTVCELACAVILSTALPRVPPTPPGHDDYAVDESELRGGIPDSGLNKLGDDLLYRVGQGGDKL